MIMLVGLLALLCRNLAVAIEITYQRLSANPQAVVLLQGFSLLSASNTRNIKTICYASSVSLRMQYFSECAIMLTV